MQSPFKLDGLFASVGDIVNLAQESIGSCCTHLIVTVEPRRHDNAISALFVVEVALTRRTCQRGAVLRFPMQKLGRDRIVAVVGGSTCACSLFKRNEEKKNVQLVRDT